MVGHRTWAQVMISRIMGSSPASGSVLTAGSLEAASDSASSSLSAPPLLMLSVSEIKKHLKKGFYFRSTEIYFLGFWRPDIWNRRAGEAGSSRGSEGESVPASPLVSARGWQSWARGPETPISASVEPSPCASPGPNFPLFTRPPVVGFRAHANPVWSPHNWVASAQTSFPNKVPFARLRTPTDLAGGVKLDPDN